MSKLLTKIASTDNLHSGSNGAVSGFARKRSNSNAMNAPVQGVRFIALRKTYIFRLHSSV